MMNRLMLCAAVLLLSANAAVAELRFTMRTEARKVAEAPDPLFAKFGEMLAAAVAPSGPSETVFIVGKDKVRMELGAPMGALPKGTVILRQPDGSAFILNPVERLYRKAPTLESRSNAMAAGEAKVSSVRTGEFETIAGLRAERITVSVSFDFTAKASQLAPGLPPVVTVDWEMWVADRYKMPPSLVGVTNPAVQALGLQKYIQDGLVMRQILRSPLFGGYEVESRILDVADQPVAAELFEVPKDYALSSGK